MMEPLHECQTEADQQILQNPPHQRPHQQPHHHLPYLHRQRDYSTTSSASQIGSGVSRSSSRVSFATSQRDSSNLDDVLEQLNTELGSLRKQHGYRSLPTEQSSHSAPAQKQSTETRGGRAGGGGGSVAFSWRSSRDEADLMENIAELDSLLSDSSKKLSEKPDGVDGSIESAAAEMPPVFSPVELREGDGAATSTSGVHRGGKFRWSSFARCHRPSLQLRDSQIAALTAPQMQEARGAAFMELNRIVREHCPPSKSLLTWFMPKVFRRQKSVLVSSSSTSTNGTGTAERPGKRSSSTSSSTVVFGVPLSTVQIRCGQPLPAGIVHLMRQLRKCGVAAHGIFRRAGGRARVAALKSRLDANPDEADFANCQPYDLADVVKLYLRELPECLITQRLSPTLMDIFTYVKSEDARLLAMQASMLLLPDENREVLQALLYFLNDFADCAETSQMGASNLAVCLAPSLFYFPHEAATGVGIGGRDAVSPRRLRRATGVPDSRDLADHRAATACLTFMIESCHQLFMLPDSIHSKPQSKQSKQLEQETQLHQSKHPPLSLDSVAPRDSSGRRHCFAFADNHAQLLARECGETAAAAGKWRQFSLRSGVETFSRSVADGHPLRMWKAVMGIDADPGDVLNKIIAERPSWDPDILSAHTVEAIDDSAEVVRFGVASPPAQPAREACLLRTWRSDSASSHRLHSVSVQLQPSHQTVQIHVLNEDWLLERVPGAGRSSSPRCRVTLLSRVDLRGRSIDWYNRIWGHSIARALVHLRKSFAVAKSTGNR
ncbi:hypothetical protein BOX15_Mlig029077g4 [Macrostomum lignano]|uniref:Rho-GAP domain-containing protein n=2 Tax=Macrostomum lignano TaxID=282301 RepID=A0A267GNN6_9PLAT|nr:hypothetical protein BOX15_Mlig029077g4 [Macrostomum lignano]